MGIHTSSKRIAKFLLSLNQGGWSTRAKGGRSDLIILSGSKNVSLFSLAFVLLSSLLENGECYKVSGRQSNGVLEHLSSSIGLFSNVVESAIRNFFCWQASIHVTIQAAAAVAV